MTIDTACSSSLVSVHQAVQTLRAGESRVAVAAGANLILGPGMYFPITLKSSVASSVSWNIVFSLPLIVFDKNLA